jgi:predicted phage terminase large subunit-like protein
MASPEADAGRGRQPSLRQWARHALRPAGLVPAAHHRKLLSCLNALARGRSDRLMLLMPPGSAKSTYTSLLLPAWWLMRFPTHSIIAASHTQDLATHFGRGLRRLVRDHEARLGYRLASDDKAANRFRTDKGGEYFATGLGGGITGRRADLVLIDDPIKSHAEADSAAQRDAVWDWYRSELVTRLRPRGRIVLIMTRWHVDDLGGRLLAGDDGWTLLRLPALAEENDPLGRRPGEALWPGWEDRDALLRKQAAVGPRVWQALYQQAPVASGGALFQVCRIDVVDAVPSGLAAVRAWDLAATADGDGRDPDWTVGVKLARDAAGRLFVLDVTRLRGGPHDVAQTILATAHRDGRAVPVGLPQDPGQAGKQQVAWLTGLLAGHRVIASPETGSKILRAGPLASQADAGNLVLLRAGWTAALIEELRDFPNGRKDDQVDALARAFAMLIEPGAPARRAQVALMGR